MEKYFPKTKLDINIENLNLKENAMFISGKNDEGKQTKPEDRYVWLKRADLPVYLDELNKKIENDFKIPQNSKLVVSVLHPPKGNKPTSIKSSKNLSKRVIVSTIDEKIKVGNGEIELKRNFALCFDGMVANMANLIFDNKKQTHTVAKKGFRNYRITKKLDKRYILVFDYIAPKTCEYDTEGMFEGTPKISEENESDTEEVNYDGFMEELMN